MKLSFCSLPSLRQACATALVCFAAGAAAPALAGPITYDMSFVSNHGVAPNAGVFTYDAETTELTDLAIFWDGLTITDFAFVEGTACGTGDLGLFNFLSRNCQASDYFWSARPLMGFTRLTFYAQGSSRTVVWGSSESYSDTFIPEAGLSGGEFWSTTPRASTVSEPSTPALLVLTGLALGWSQRRRLWLRGRSLNVQPSA